MAFCAAGLLVLEEVVADELLLVVDVLLGPVADDHVVEALVRVARDLRPLADDRQVVLEAALPVQLAVQLEVLHRGDAVGHVRGAGLGHRGVLGQAGRCDLADAPYHRWPGGESRGRGGGGSAACPATGWARRGTALSEPLGNAEPHGLNRQSSRASNSLPLAGSGLARSGVAEGSLMNVRQSPPSSRSSPLRPSLPLLAGCAEDDYETATAAYPRAHRLHPHRAPVGAGRRRLPRRTPREQVQVQPQDAPDEQGAAPGDEVAIDGAARRRARVRPRGPVRRHRSLGADRLPLARSIPTASGSTTRRTAPSGSPRRASSARTSRRTRRRATGPTTTSTRGSATTTGAGPPSTTAAGSTRARSAGGGSRAASTPARGSTGATATATGPTSAGGRWRPRWCWRGGVAVGLGFVPRVRPTASSAAGTSSRRTCASGWSAAGRRGRRAPTRGPGRAPRRR